MVAQDPHEKRKRIYRLDAVTFYKLKAVVDANNKLLKELREKDELKDKMIRKLTAERDALQYLQMKFSGLNMFGKAHEE